MDTFMLFSTSEDISQLYLLNNSSKEVTKSNCSYCNELPEELKKRRKEWIKKKLIKSI